MSVAADLEIDGAGQQQAVRADHPADAAARESGIAERGRLRRNSAADSRRAGSRAGRIRATAPAAARPVRCGKVSAAILLEIALRIERGSSSCVLANVGLDQREAQGPFGARCPRAGTSPQRPAARQRPRQAASGVRAAPATSAAADQHGQARTAHKFPATARSAASPGRSNGPSSDHAERVPGIAGEHPAAQPFGDDPAAGEEPARARHGRAAARKRPAPRRRRAPG